MPDAIALHLFMQTPNALGFPRWRCSSNALHHTVACKHPPYGAKHLTLLIRTKSPLHNSSMQGTNLLRGTTHIPENLRTLYMLNAHSRSKLQAHYYTFIRTAPVGNSSIHLNLRKLTAGDLLSLQENDALLCTFKAFDYSFVSYSIFLLLSSLPFKYLPTEIFLGYCSEVTHFSSYRFSPIPVSRNP